MRPNRTPLSAAQQALAADEHNLNYARRVGARFARAYPALADDFRSAVLLALVEAARSFDPAAGVPFRSGVLSARARGACLDVFRALRPKGYRRREGVWARRVSVSAGDRDRHADRFHPADPGEVGEGLEAVEAVFRLTRGLPPRYRTALRLYYTGAGMDCVAVGRALGISESGASVAIRKALAMLREDLAGRAVG